MSKMVDTPRRAENRNGLSSSSQSVQQLVASATPDFNLNVNSAYSPSPDSHALERARRHEHDLTCASQTQLSHNFTATTAAPTMPPEQNILMRNKHRRDMLLSQTRTTTPQLNLNNPTSTLSIEQQELMVAKQRHGNISQNMKSITQVNNPKKCSVPFDLRCLPRGHMTNNSLKQETTNITSSPYDFEEQLRQFQQLQGTAATLVEMGRRDLMQPMHPEQQFPYGNGHYPALPHMTYKEQVLMQRIMATNRTDASNRLTAPVPQNQYFSADNRHYHVQNNGASTASGDWSFVASNWSKMGQSTFSPPMANMLSSGIGNTKLQDNSGALRTSSGFSRGLPDASATNNHLDLNTHLLDKTSAPLVAEEKANTTSNMALNNTHLPNGGFQGRNLPMAAALTDNIFHVQNPNKNAGTLHTSSAFSWGVPGAGATDSYLGPNTQLLDKTSVASFIAEEKNNTITANTALNNTQLPNGGFEVSNLPIALTDNIFNDENPNKVKDFSRAQYPRMDRHSASLDASTCPPLDCKVTASASERALESSSAKESKKSVVANHMALGNIIQTKPQLGATNSVMERVEPIKTKGKYNKIDKLVQKKNERGKLKRNGTGEAKEKHVSVIHLKSSNKRFTELKEDWRPSQVLTSASGVGSDQASAQTNQSATTCKSALTIDVAKKLKSPKNRASESEDDWRPLEMCTPTPRSTPKKSTFKKPPPKQENIVDTRLRKSRRSQNIGVEHARLSCVSPRDGNTSESKEIKGPILEKSEQIKAQSPIAGQKQLIHTRKRRIDCDLAPTNPSAVTKVHRETTNADIVKMGPSEGGATKKIVPSSAKVVGANAKLRKVENMSQMIHKLYPYAPMGQLWLDKSLSSSKSHDAGMTSAKINAGGTLIGRRWVWDEGYFVDDHFDPQPRARGRELEPPLLECDRSDVDQQLRKKGQELEDLLRKRRCTCGSSHLSNTELPSNDGKSYGRARRRERSASSYSSNVTMQLASGQLDPHTLISCEEYKMGPEFRFTKNVQSQPFCVRVNPDATFLADLHAHLCSSEIIGLLGGHYSNEEKCIYIQAAFPCKSTNRTDSGQTDVEMDPIGQIYATEAIANHGMSVVGWYHSHPDFQPNPSITDIENQASYQQLFQGDNLVSRKSGKSVESVPFVGLIVGTYDGKHPSSQSVMRWFHCQSKDTGENKSVNYPMNLKTTNRHFRKMTFDNKSVENNIRRSMTMRGTDIREVLESRYLCCPCTEVPHSDVSHTMRTVAGRRNKLRVNEFEQKGGLGIAPAVPSNKHKENQPEKLTRPNCHSQAHLYENKKVSTEECTLSMIETGEAPLLLSESLFCQKANIPATCEKDSNQMLDCQSARPLYFTENERSILETTHDTVPEDVLAGIIWFAVEREQQMLPKCDADGNLLIAPDFPASSRSILDLLLEQSSTSSKLLHRKLYCSDLLDDNGSGTLNDWFDDNDAVIFHNVDAVLAHYAPKLNKINPFSSWSGAGDKGNISNNCSGSSVEPPFFEFYLTKILKMKKVPTDEGQTYQGGIKMKRGHKIAACLLKWACNMQPGSINNESDKRVYFPFEDSHESGLRFDHEQKLCDEMKTAGAISSQHGHYIYFVSEVMRLMAARWRECGGKTKQGVPKRRGRPPK